MSIEENKAIVRRLMAATNELDLDVLDELMSPELAQRYKVIIPLAREMFAGHHGEITDLIGEGDKVVARVATSGGHTGEWMGIPPTGRQWTNTGVQFYRFADGKVVEFDSMYDRVNHLQQLGAKIVPPEEGGG